MRESGLTAGGDDSNLAFYVVAQASKTRCLAPSSHAAEECFPRQDQRALFFVNHNGTDFDRDALTHLLLSA
jgi:hypothetical protein